MANPEAWLSPSSADVFDIRAAFKHAVPMKPEIWRNPQGHEVLCDPEFSDRCGYATRDEAALVARVARQVVNFRSDPVWVEIGSHTGWTLMHAAMEFGDERTVIGVDPEYEHPGYNATGEPFRFLRRTQGNADRVFEMISSMDGKPSSDDPDGPWRSGWPHWVGEKSGDFLGQGLRAATSGFGWVKASGREMFDVRCSGLLRKRYAEDGFWIDGAMIDGEHEAPFPFEDACLLLPHLSDDAVVMFHDAMSPAVQMGIRYLVENGFKWRLYMTPQLVAICWRGEKFQPLEHIPDPRFNWGDWLKNSIRLDSWLMERQCLGGIP